MRMKIRKYLGYFLLYLVQVAFLFVLIVWNRCTGIRGLVWYGTVSAAAVTAGILLVLGELSRFREKRRVLSCIFGTFGAVLFLFGLYSMIPVVQDAVEGPKEYTVVCRDITWNEESAGFLNRSDGSITFLYDGETVTLPLDDSSMICLRVAEADETVTVSEWIHTGLVNRATCPSHEALMKEWNLEENDHGSDVVFLILIAGFMALLMGFRLLEKPEKNEKSSNEIMK